MSNILELGKRLREQLLVHEGSLEKANRVGTAVRTLLEKHRDLITSEVVDTIVQREVSSALREYGQLRMEGYQNDDSSKKPGITLFLTPVAADAVILLCKEEGYPIPPEQTYALSDTVSVLRFPKGAYSMGFGGAQFYQEASEDYAETHRAAKPFALSYDDVIRVEGDTNELWQNWHYAWDGTPKAPR